MNKRWMACLALHAATLSGYGCGSPTQTETTTVQPMVADVAGASAQGAGPTTVVATGASGTTGSSAAQTSTASAGAKPSSPDQAVSTAAAAGTSAPVTQPTAAGAGGAVAAQSPDQSPTPEQPAGKPRRAIVTDFLNGTLSVVDVDKLTEGAKREDALIGTVDMSKYVPGPLTVTVTPDGKTALVSVSGGWLRLLPSGTDIAAGAGMLVFVDLEKLEVTGDLNLGTDPLGIAITPDGKHAFVGLMSESYMAYVDIEKKSYEPIQTGNQWNEELSIDDSGTSGVLTTGTAGDAMTFSVATPMTHGQTRGLTGDAGGVAFFPGSKFAFVVQAPTDLTGRIGGYNVIDATNPATPMVTDSVRTSGDPGQAYPVAPVLGRKTVVYPSSDLNTKKLTLKEMALLEGGKAQMMQTLELTEPATFMYGLAASAEGLVLGAIGSEHFLVVADLNTQKVHTIPWGVSKTGPMDVKFIP